MGDLSNSQRRITSLGIVQCFWVSTMHTHFQKWSPGYTYFMEKVMDEVSKISFLDVLTVLQIARV